MIQLNYQKKTYLKLFHKPIVNTQSQATVSLPQWNYRAKITIGHQYIQQKTLQWVKYNDSLIYQIEAHIQQRDAKSPRLKSQINPHNLTYNCIIFRCHHQWSEMGISWNQRVVHAPWSPGHCKVDMEWHAWSYVPIAIERRLQTRSQHAPEDWTSVYQHSEWNQQIPWRASTLMAPHVSEH